MIYIQCAFKVLQPIRLKEIEYYNYSIYYEYVVKYIGDSNAKMTGTLSIYSIVKGRPF